MIKRLLTILLFVLCAGLFVICTGCANDPTSTRNKLLVDTLRSYGATLRWNGIEGGEVFLDPAYRKQHPLTSLDIDRYKQVRLADYDDEPPVSVGDNEVTQVVKISVINRHTQTVRSLVDRQVWHYDEKSKHWWLMSGLPDITQRQ